MTDYSNSIPVFNFVMDPARDIKQKAIMFALLFIDVLTGWLLVVELSHYIAIFTMSYTLMFFLIDIDSPVIKDYIKNNLSFIFHTFNEKIHCLCMAIVFFTSLIWCSHLLIGIIVVLLWAAEAYMIHIGIFTRFDTVEVSKEETKEPVI